MVCMRYNNKAQSRELPTLMSVFLCIGTVRECGEGGITGWYTELEPTRVYSCLRRMTKLTMTDDTRTAQRTVGP